MTDIATLGLEVRSDGVVVATDRLKKLERQSGHTAKGVERVARQAQRMGQEMQRVGRSLSLRVTAPIVGLGVAAVRAFGNFDDAMTSSLAIMGDVSDALRKDMSDAAREMGRTTVFSATQAAESYFFLASAGLDAAASIAALPRVAAFAQAGNFDMARATDILTDAQSALGKVMEDPIANMKEMTALSDVLVKANTVANASVEQFGEALTNKAGAAIRQLNIDVETGVAVLAAWADQGVKGAAAGERFNIVTRDLQTAIRNNREEFDRFNISVFDSEGGMRNLADIIANLEDVLGSMSVEQQGATLNMLGFQDRSVQAIRSLIGLSGQIKEYEKDLKSAGGITDEVADKQLASFNKQMGLLKDEIVDIAIEIGGSLVPVIKQFRESSDGALQSIRDWAEWFSEADDSTKKLVLSVTAFAALAGPMLIFLGAIVRNLRFMVPLMKVLLGTSVGLIGTGILAFFGTMYVNVKRANKQIAEIGSETESFREILATMQDAVSGAFDGQQLNVFRSALNDINAEIKEAQELLAEAHKQRMMTPTATPTFGRGTESERQAAENIRALKAERDALIETLEARKRVADAFPDQAERYAMGQRVIQQASASAVEWLGRFGIAIGQSADDVEQAAQETAGAAAHSREFEQALNRLAASLAGEVAQAQQAYNEKLAKATELAEKGEIGDEQLTRAKALYRQELEAAISVSDDFVRSLEDMEASMAGPVAVATLEFNRSVEEAGELLSENRIGLMEYLRALQLYAAQLEKVKQQERDRSGFTFGIDFDFVKKSLNEVQRQMQEIAAIEWGFENLIDSFHPLAAELRNLKDSIEHIDLALNKGLISEAEAGFWKAGAAANSMFNAIMEGMDRSSKAYQQMAIAQEVLNTVLGVAAVLKTASTAPWPVNFIAMAKMAAMVASLGVSIGGMSGSGGANVSQNRQDAQGTGSVLGDMEAKSESIANAIETTADATSKLVGINRGMLRTLQAMQAAIAGASGMIARGAGDIDMSNLSLGRSNWGFTSTRLVDQGIALMGGAIADMTEGAVAQAFAETRKSNLFSTKYRTHFEDLDDAFNDQLNLIFRSMIETVESAGEALGIPLADIQARIATFQIAARQISLEGLTAEEQQAELEAVFSKIFDDFARHVVPFIGQFQRLGEGIGETLIRVATGVQVMQEAIHRLGFSLDAASPEKFAQASEGLIELAGGLDQFIESMGTFFSKFAPEAKQFEILQSDLTRALEQAGLAVPETRDAMWDLMQSLDATTAEGQEQIATLLRLAEVADQYYSLLEKEEQERLRRAADLVSMMRDIHDQTLDLISPAHAEYNQLAQEMAAQIQLLKELGASERQLGDLRRMHTLQMQAMAAALRESIKNLTEQLFDDRSMEQASQSVGQHMNNIRDQIIRGIEGVQEWLDRQHFRTSSMMPEDRLQEAESQFLAAIAAAESGDVDILRDLPRLADQFLGEGASFFGTSTSDFAAIESMVRSAMEGITGIDVPDEQQQMQAVVEATQQTALSAAEQVMLGSDLLQRIAVLSRITGDSPSDIARELGVPIGDLMAIMGEVPGLTGDALEMHFDEVVGAIDDELSVLMDLQSIEQSALDTLLRIERILSQDWTVPIPSDMGIADMHIGGPVVGDGIRNLQDGEYVVPRGGTLVADSGGWSQVDQRLARLEHILERGNDQREEHIRTTGEGFGAVVHSEQATRRDIRQALDKAPRQARGMSTA